MVWLIGMGVVVLLVVAWVAIDHWADKKEGSRKSAGGGTPNKYQV